MLKVTCLTLLFSLVASAQSSQNTPAKKSQPTPTKSTDATKSTAPPLNPALKAKLQESLGKISGLTESTFSVAAQSSQMTYKELFSLLESTLQSQNNLVVDLRSLSCDDSCGLVDQLVSHINCKNELVRAKRNVYQSLLDQSRVYSEVRSGALHDRLTPPDSAPGTLRDHIYTAHERVLQEIEKACVQVSDKAGVYLTLYTQAVDMEDSLADVALKKGLRFVPTLKMSVDSTKKLADLAAFDCSAAIDRNPAR